MAEVGSSEAAALSVAATSQLPVEDDQERETAEPAVSPVEPKLGRTLVIPGGEGGSDPASVQDPATTDIPKSAMIRSRCI